MIAHKLAIFRAHSQLSRKRQFKTDYHSSMVLGGRATLRIVRAILKVEIQSGKKLLMLAQDFNDALEWWAEYEGMIDDNLQSTLRFIIPIKNGESEIAYNSRLEGFLALVREPLSAAGLSDPTTVPRARARVQAAVSDTDSENESDSDNANQNGQSNVLSIDEEGRFTFDLGLDIREKPKGPKRSK